MPATAPNQLLLRLRVMRDRVIWQRFLCELESNKQEEDSRRDLDGVPLGHDAREVAARAKSIALLADLQQLVADMRRSASWDAGVIDAIAYRVVEALGEQLYRFLFRGELDQVLNAALAATANGVLRIELEFDGDAPKDYARWPWEYLRSPYDEKVSGSGQYLALRTQLVLNRRLDIDARSAVLRTGRPVVLLVVAGPPGRELGEFGVVQAGKVLSTLEELDRAGVIELVPLVEPPYELAADWRPTASWDEFKRLVREREPDVIHFIGHGQRVYNAEERAEHSRLVFVGARCEPDPRRDEDFVNAVMGDTKLKLVFLQACESGVPGPHASATSVGQRLAHSGIPAVVAMQTKVENVVANDFAQAFYTALRAYKPIDVAVREGREAIQEVSPSLKLAFGVPVLYLRSYEPLLQPPATAGKSSVPERALSSCPRCGSAQVAKVCPSCGLRLACKDCSQPLARETDPERARITPVLPFCSACGTHNVQPPWTPPGALPDRIEPPAPRVH